MSDLISSCKVYRRPDLSSMAPSSPSTDLMRCLRGAQSSRWVYSPMLQPRKIRLITRVRKTRNLENIRICATPGECRRVRQSIAARHAFQAADVALQGLRLGLEVAEPLLGLEDLLL